MSYMLSVAAFQVGYPVVLFVLVEADDPPWDRRPRTCVSLHCNLLTACWCDIVANCFGVPIWIMPSALLCLSE